MAMYNYGLDNFTLVEQLYNRVKPIRNTKIVPIGDRKRKYQCIIKISPTCYALSDVGNQTSLYNSYAVVWRRNADNTDTVELRNNNGDWAHNGRYSFLERCMPYGMIFVVNGGKQFIRMHGTDYRYYLPKDEGFTVALTSGPHKADGLPKKWTLTSKPHPEPVTRVRVNKERKAQYKKHIDEYLHWAWTMAPMLEGTMNSKSDSAAALVAARVKWGGKFSDVLTDKEHPLRTELIHAFLAKNANGRKNIIGGDPKEFRAKFNTWVNVMGNFTEYFVELK